jgi:hypothetical protein
MIPVMPRHAMRVFENRELHSDDLDDRDTTALFCDIEFRRCYFQGCTLSITRNPALRSTVRNVRLIDCSQRGCYVDCAVIEETVVDGFNTNGQLFQTFGAVFNHVLLRGKIDRLMISNDSLPDLSVNRPYQYEVVNLFRVANAEYYRHVEWALDISEGEFKELDIRGIPSRLIRRDPETQVVVTKQRLLDGDDWQYLTFDAAPCHVAFQLLLESDDPDTIIVAPKRHPKFRNFMEDLKLLREAGLAEPD